jgi:hypothetical protein
MVKAIQLIFNTPKTLPTPQMLLDQLGIIFNSTLQQFEHLATEQYAYRLNDFLANYYYLEFTELKRKFESRLGCIVDDNGYIIGNNQTAIPIRNLAYYANKVKKLTKELFEIRESGRWVKYIGQNFLITTSHTEVVIYFIDAVIFEQILEPDDIIMLKCLKRITEDICSEYRIFKSVDFKDKKLLFT